MNSFLLKRIVLHIIIEIKVMAVKHKMMVNLTVCCYFWKLKTSNRQNKNILVWVFSKVSFYKSIKLTRFTNKFVFGKKYLSENSTYLSSSSRFSHHIGPFVPYNNRHLTGLPLCWQSISRTPGSRRVDHRSASLWLQMDAASRRQPCFGSSCLPPSPPRQDHKNHLYCDNYWLLRFVLFLFLLIGHQASRMVDIRREMSVIS